jgi:hypothetical protein
VHGRLIATGAVALGLVCALALPAAAKPPPGDWTLVRNDGVKHYACRAPAKGDFWRIRTATWWNGRRSMLEQGVYVALARGSNRNIVTQRNSDKWEKGYIRFSLRGARLSDRLWMQSAGYGPVEPWSDGKVVRRLTRCASIA